ncbi:MAG: nuclear transport factor 2 family protein [Acidobacteriota bacterium]|nr:nuclear transport factor 2 family protein [Acidobacteriota bacterium]
MKRLFVFLLLVFLTLHVAMGSAQTKPRRQPRTSAAASPTQPPLTDAEAGEQLRKRLQEVLNAWSTMDPDTASRYYAKDADLVFFDLAPFQYKGWDEYYVGSKKLFQNYQSLSIRLNEDASVHWKGDLAYATATWNVLGTLADGTLQKLDLRWTVVLERRNNEWVVVHEHVSAPLSGAAAPGLKPAAQPATQLEKKPTDPFK